MEPQWLQFVIPSEAKDLTIIFCVFAKSFALFGMTRV